MPVRTRVGIIAVRIAVRRSDKYAKPADLSKALPPLPFKPEDVDGFLHTKYMEEAIGRLAKRSKFAS